MATIFSRIIQKEIPAYIIQEDELFIAFLDIFPIKMGHVLVVPKIEVDKIFDLPESYLAKILVFAQPIAKAIEKAFPCNRVNIITVGLEVPHTHIHLIPTDQTADVNLLAPKLTLTREDFIEIQDAIKKHL